MELKELVDMKFRYMFKLAFKAIPALFLAQALWIAIVLFTLAIIITAVCSLFDINPVYYLYQYLGMACV